MGWSSKYWITSEWDDFGSTFKEAIAGRAHETEVLRNDLLSLYQAFGGGSSGLHEAWFFKTFFLFTPPKTNGWFTRKWWYTFNLWRVVSMYMCIIYIYIYIYISLGWVNPLNNHPFSPSRQLESPGFLGSPPHFQVDHPKLPNPDDTWSWI